MRAANMGNLLLGCRSLWTAVNLCDGRTARRPKGQCRERTREACCPEAKSRSAIGGRAAPLPIAGSNELELLRLFSRIGFFGIARLQVLKPIAGPAFSTPVRLAAFILVLIGLPPALSIRAGDFRQRSFALDVRPFRAEPFSAPQRFDETPQSPPERITAGNTVCEFGLLQT